MTSISGATSATSSAPATKSIPSKNTTAASTPDILSSFKEILSLMTATSGMSSATPSTGMGMNMSDLMAPLMLLMIERLVEQELGQESSTTDAEQTSAIASSQTSTAVSNQTSAEASNAPQPEPSRRPVTGGWISQGYHSGHTALDIAVPVGTSVKSTMDGKVIYAGWNDQGYGNLVIVENGDYRTYYAHLSSIPVSVGEEVTAGTAIGLSGNTGHSTGPHLHYEIRKNKVAIDPTSVTLGTN